MIGLDDQEELYLNFSKCKQTVVLNHVLLNFDHSTCLYIHTNPILLRCTPYAYCIMPILGGYPKIKKWAPYP